MNVKIKMDNGRGEEKTVEVPDDRPLAQMLSLQSLSAVVYEFEDGTSWRYRRAE
jgi:hypothetical protein